MGESNCGPTDDFSLAHALLRITRGVNIAMHGISRILAGVGVFAAALEKQFAATALPNFVVKAVATAFLWAEASNGLLVLAGAAARRALVAGGLLVLALSFGSAVHQDWEITSLRLTYAVLYSLFIALREYDLLSLDRLLGRLRHNG
jgi:thiosulfate dehydrogenase (quinone) large subunit